MSDRAIIAVEDGDTLRAVYCHNDGSRTRLGRCLLEHYPDKERANVLIALGHLSCVGSKLEPDPGLPHSVEHPQRDTTVAYHRDRGEDLRIDTVPITHGVLNAINETGIDGEFVYVFHNGAWTYLAGHTLRKLTEKNTTPKT